MRNIKLTEIEFRYLYNSLNDAEAAAIDGFRCDASSKTEFYRMKLFQEELTRKIKTTKKETI